MVGADLANLVNEAALNAARYNQKVVRMHDFEFAKDKVLMGSERRSMIISDAEKRVTAIHEAGHALLTVLLPHADEQGALDVGIAPFADAGFKVRRDVRGLRLEG